MLKFLCQGKRFHKLKDIHKARQMGLHFFRHRAGRISASMSGAVCRTNPAQPSQSLIQSVCYPHLFKVNTKAVLHGCKHEADAIKAYEEEMKISY